MPATESSGSSVTRVVLERLLRPVWNALVAYGAMWLPADQNPLWAQYRYDTAPDPRPAAPASAAGGSDVTDSGRKTLSAS
jgi:hypothetical protein